MPDPSHRAHAALETPGRVGRSAVALRLAIGALFTLSVLIVPQVTSPEPVAAGSTCTGWTSKLVPPKTIRVLRTRTGKVETVGFRQYVARVMASGEWPSRLKMATLEVGALATKQYAWYYAMKGNHRSHYVRGGRCYDVRDDTNDQLYRHYAVATDRQWKALDKTWALTLRKNGRFFLTGYRAGGTSTCAADANGWKIYAKSVQACAKKGWSYTRILKKYLNPNLRLVWSDKIGPAMASPKVRLKAGNAVSSGAATISWKPLRAKAHVTRFRIQRKAASGAWKTIELAKPTDQKVESFMKLGARNRFRVKARDARGNWGHWAYSTGQRAAVRGPAGTVIAGGAGTAAVRSQRIKKRFTGRSVAVVAKTGPGMGSIKVFINGKRVARVDLERGRASGRELVWAQNFVRSGPRTIAIKPMGSRERVVFQGFYILR